MHTHVYKMFIIYMIYYFILHHCLKTVMLLVWERKKERDRQTDQYLILFQGPGAWSYSVSSNKPTLLSQTMVMSVDPWQVARAEKTERAMETAN